MRSDWNKYFMALAEVVSTRSTCDRAHVGCVIVRDKIILSTGYNGSLPGADHCDTVGHDIVDGHCVRTIHSEANAVAQAARNGVSLYNSTAYITHSPCLACFKLLASAGIKTIYYKNCYRMDKVLEYAKKSSITMVELTD